uniref:Uncharacterized protein n=1 Tax=Romanomermis culicivorax TaxID=13658 RepID=A0A915IRK4_ROMCU
MVKHSNYELVTQNTSLVACSSSPVGCSSSPIARAASSVKTKVHIEAVIIMENDAERRSAVYRVPDRNVNHDTSLLRLYPGRSNEILIVHNEDEFEEHFEYFVDTLKASKFPVIGFNTKWDYTLTSQKQRTKNRQRAYNKFSRETDDSDEPHHIREIRKSKEASGHIAIISMSNLYGVTLQIRTCLFQRHNLPLKLKTFLESMDSIKVGFGLRRDMYRLWEEEIIHLNRNSLIISYMMSGFRKLLFFMFCRHT